MKQRFKKNISSMMLCILIILICGGCNLFTDKSNNSEIDPVVDPEPDPIEDPVSEETSIWFVKQEKSDNTSDTTATITDGIISLSSYYSASSNVYKADSGKGYNYVNSNANFLAFPVKMTGDFSVEATVTVNEQTKSGNASGIGIGMYDGFSSDSNYAYVLMRNGNNTAQGYYTKGLANVGTGGINVSYSAGTEMILKMSRIGETIQMYANSSDGTIVSDPWEGGLGNFYGCADDVYAGLSFGNVKATVSNFIIKNGVGDVVFNSSASCKIEYLIPSSISASSDAIDIPLNGGTFDITAYAVALGGENAEIDISGYDTSIISVIVSGSTLTVTPKSSGNTSILVTNTSDTSKTLEISVTVSDFADSDVYGSLTTVYPSVNETNAYTDGELSITFDSSPTLETGGTIRIYNADSGVQVDNIGFANEVQSSWGSSIVVDDQLVRVESNTIYFTPHFDSLDYGTNYYISIPTTAISGTLNGISFNGLSNDSSIASWYFSTREAPVLSTTSVTVDGSQSSTADFRTVQGALNYLETGLGSDEDINIEVAEGVYTELIYYKGGKNITIAGPDGNDRGDNCVIQYKNSTIYNGSTHTRASVYISGSNLTLKNLTLINMWERDAGSAQAEAIYFANGNGKRLVAYNSSFMSHQDTIQTTGRNWFYDCYIEGDVDFIWGTADVALFENCYLKSLNDPLRSSVENALIVARTASKTSNLIGKGYVILNSTITIEDGITLYLGRNAGSGDFYDQAAIINTSFISQTGTLGASLWQDKTAPSVLDDSTAVGWKDYGNTLNGEAVIFDDTARNDNSSALDNSTYTTEYSGRNTILNRLYNVTDAAYEASSSVWDYSAYENEFNAVTDESLITD